MFLYDLPKNYCFSFAYLFAQRLKVVSIDPNASVVAKVGDFGNHTHLIHESALLC